MANKKTPKFVIAYDFDGTLSPGNMQEYDFIPALDKQPNDFWQEANAIANNKKSDQILAYMYLMLEASRAKKISIRKEKFTEYGKTIKFFDGVQEWFSRVNAYARQRNIEVEHYIISSGLREMIEATAISHEFKKIYASGFLYDENDVAVWPAMAVNYTTKTQFLFRINKGSLNVSDDSKINKYMPEDERDVPFSHMLFIGDGETDIPAMRMVKSQGGHSIAVYQKNDTQAKCKALKLVGENRIDIAVAADYTAESALDKAVKAIIDMLAAHHILLKAGQD